MADSQPHEMQLVRMHESGAEEWHCPTCGRRFLMHWPPEYRKVVLEAGDEYAAHVGGKGGLRISGADVAPAEYGEPELMAQPDAPPLPVEEVGPTPITDEMRPWLRWMRDAGLADGQDC